MRFLLKSAFWLMVMGFIIAPKGTDFGKLAADASAEALKAGQQAIVTQALATDCSSLQCAGGKVALTVLAAPQIPSVDTPMQNSSIPPVPLPRPRPDRMG